jgi:hypothetical protein
MLNTSALSNGEWDVHVLPGAQQSQPEITTCATTPPPTSTTNGTPAKPVVQTGGGQPLPFTGVGVLAYAIPATALIAIGTAAMLLAHRRGHTH